MEYQIDIKEKVVLNGLKQKIHILGTDPKNKVILMLHGGPGISNRHSVVTKQADLTDDFTIVAWDQRGTGGSYHGCKKETLTLDNLVLDAKALVEYLCEKLHKDKIYIIGGSWGTELGTFLCYRFPEHIGGYIGYGQVVNGVQNETISYDYCVKMATEANDSESLEILKRVGPPIGGQYNPCFEGMMAHRKILAKYGGHDVKKTSYWEGTVKPILFSKEYSIADKWGMIKGYKLCLSYMWPTIVNYDFKFDCNKFEMPYYIFQGRLDKNTPSDLIEDFYKVIDAPKKELVWFENSAHGPLSEEPEKFKALIREKFLD
ncbi:MAG: alpha/beta hydrolase [Clostridia bacterium]